MRPPQTSLASTGGEGSFMCLIRRRGGRLVRQHAESALIDVEQRLLLVEIILVHSPDANQLAHDLGVEAVALGLGVDLLDVAAERALFLFEPLDPLDKRAQRLAGNPPNTGPSPPH